MNRIILFIVSIILITSCSQEKEVDEYAEKDLQMPLVQIESVDKVRIAVVGGGIAGASYVHFIDQALGPQCDIKLYEREDRLGGRVRKDTLGGGLIEQGATLIHSSNYYLQDLMATHDLKRSVPHGGEGEAETLAIWDGEEFVLNTSTNKSLSGMQMLWAYGRSLFDVEKEVKKAIPNWKSVYDLLQDGKGFKTPKEMFETIGLYDMTQRSAYDYFKEVGIKDKVVYEFIDCVSRVNYHQDGNINAFTDIVSLAGAGMDGGELFSVEGGNDLMITSALTADNVTVHLGEGVKEIKTLVSETRDQHVVLSEAGLADTFDVVIVACPLDLAGITLPQYNIKMDREYQEVHAYFIAGEIDYAYFGGVTNSPQTIFTMEKEEVPFISIAKTGYAEDWDVPIYKVFSRNKLDEGFFNQTFSNIKGQLHHEWRAYTVLSPMKEWPPFEISEGLYYINAMESAVSAMETESVAARNAANLTVEFLSNDINDQKI